MAAFRIYVRDDVTKVQWHEDYNRRGVIDQPTALAEGQRVIDNWNATLQPHERPRTLIAAVFGEGGAHLAHEWEKTNLITIIRGNRNFDTAQCKVCKITGKRYGVSDIKRDSDFRGKSFEYCDTTLEAQQRRKGQVGR